MRTLCAIAELIIAGGTASAQTNALVIKTSNPISPAQPSATVEVWAKF